MRAAWMATIAMTVVFAAGAGAVTPTYNMRMGINVSISPPGGNVLDASLLADLRPFKIIRFMDWAGTNGNEGRVVSDADCIRLCNALDADGWFCVKHTADDNYVRGLAQQLRDQLEPGLKCYIEYSNETWNVANPFYIQTYYCYERALNLGLTTDPTPAGDENDIHVAAYYHAYRVVQMAQIFQSVFGSQMASRVVMVVASCYAAPSLTQTLIMALKDPKVNPNGVLVNAFAIAPYFGAEEAFSTVARATELANATRAFVGTHNGAIRNSYNTPLGANAKLIGYEGGMHFASGQDAFARNSGAYDVYTAYLNAIGVLLDQFCAYTYTTGLCSSEHCWGVKEYTGQPNSQAHKYRALIDWAAAHPYSTVAVARDAAEPVSLQVQPLSGAAGLRGAVDLRGRWLSGANSPFAGLSVTATDGGRVVVGIASDACSR